MFENMTNEQVKAVIDTWEKIPSDEVARQALYQVFVVNKTPLSYDPNKLVCVYNPSINGMGCAAGVLVREDLKDHLIENDRIGGIIANDDVMAKYFGESQDYAESVQKAHDQWAFGLFPTQLVAFHKFLEDNRE